MRTRKRTKFVALAVGLALVAAACGDDKKSSSTNAPEPTGGTETTVADTPPVDSTEPTDTTATSDSAPGTGEAAMRVTYTLSDVAVWDDGSPITVDDFQCTLDAIMTTPGSLSTTGYDQIISIATGDTDKDIVVEFMELYAPWKGLFSGLLKASVTPDCTDVSDEVQAIIDAAGQDQGVSR